MTIDDDAAWAAILAARRAWRGPGPRGRIEAPAGSSGIIVLETDGRFSANAPLSPSAGETLTIFAPIVAARQLAVGQLGQSLDGRIATRSGRSHYITGPQGLLHLHRLRAVADAVVVGAATVAADDPQLTVRRCPGDNPVRVVIDPSGRLAGSHRVFDDGQARSLVLRDAATAPETGSTIALAGTPAGIAPHDILAALAARGLNRVLIEGGATTITRFLAAGALNTLHIVVAPLILGAGRDAFALPGVDSLDEVPRMPVRHHRLGDDMLFVLHLS